MVLQGRKKIAVKADLAIYSPMYGVYVWYLSLPFMLSYKLDFNSCAIRDSFRKSSHICDGIDDVCELGCDSCGTP